MESSHRYISIVQNFGKQIEEKNARIKELESLLRPQEGSTTLNPVSSDPEKSQENHGPNINSTNPPPYSPPKNSHETNPLFSPERPHYPLLSSEYQRYGRQMILPEIGLPGQLALKSSRVLIVGLGGLGCPAAAYLSGAGVGVLGLIDGDTVEVSNLHRQILHTAERVGWWKVDSAVESLRRLNPHVEYNPIRENLTPSLAATIFPSYDLILDCTDRPATRYLVSDAAVLCGKPLVTASAVKSEGQLIVLNSPPKPAGDETGSPCYRCIFPRPPPLESVTSCAEGGILGPVVGTMGVLQALEAIKVITATSTSEEGEGKRAEGEAKPTSMLIFSAYLPQQFRNIVFRRRKKSCTTCGNDPKITLPMFLDDSVDYATLCGVMNPVRVLRGEERVEAEEYERVRGRKEEHVLIDTRDATQFEICHLEGSVNVPIEDVRADAGSDGEARWMQHLRGGPVYLVCRLGNDSQEAVRLLKDRLGSVEDEKGRIKDIRGGLRAWRERVDGEFPEY